MKTLHIIDKLALGGPATLLKGIFEKHITNDHIFLYILRRTDIIVDIKHPKIIIYYSKNKFSFQPLQELKRIIENERIDILHCHEHRSKLFGWLLKKKLFPNIKLVFHEHGDIFKNNMIYNKVLQFSIPQADLYIAVSRSTKQHLIKKANIPEDKIVVLYNFVDLAKYNRNNIVWSIKKKKEKINLKRDDFVIGFAARLIESKGWRTIIESAELLLNYHPEVKFLIAGDGKDKAKLLQLIDSKQLHRAILFLGYVSDMTWFYSILDCFVISSYREAMGLTGIEAQAMATPLISSEIETLHEIICDRENGLFFEPQNEKDLADKISLLYEDHNLRQRIIAGGLETVKEYSLSNYIENLNRLYDNLP